MIFATTYQELGVIEIAARPRSVFESKNVYKKVDNPAGMWIMGTVADSYTEIGRAHV